MADSRSEKLMRLEKQNSFYRVSYQKIIFILIVMMFATLPVTGYLLYQVFHRPIPQFSAIANSGEKMGLVSFDEPNYLPSTILTWASKAAVAAYSFDFVNYEKEIALVRPYFTDSGWLAYRAAISRVIGRVTQGQLFVSGVVSGKPVISNQGPLPGHGYSWRVQIPFLASFQSAEETKTNNYVVILLLVKVPTNINPQGIGIDQFQMV